MDSRAETLRRPSRWRWVLVVLGAVVVAALAVIASIVIPILTHEDGGLSHQQTQEEWADTATATGDDGRTRTITISTASGGEVDPAQVRVGDRIVVRGEGFDGGQGVYVAVCAVPDSAEVKPGPCIGGAPQQSQDPEEHAGEIQWAPSTWVNNDWAWRLFGARSYDDAVAGTFTAYLEIAEPVEVDCDATPCAIVVRNDHTAADDRVQDVYLPIRLTG